MEMRREVWMDGNQIYFFADFSTETINELIKLIMKGKDKKDLTINVKSYGGSVNELFIAMDSSSVIEKTVEEQLGLGKPLDFDKNEEHSFSEWLKITSFKPIIRDEEITEKHEPITQQSLDEKLNLIDKFIATKPKIKPIKQQGQIINLANANNIQPESLMTETLARIYLEQNQYKKAMQAYRILSLKYPEKSGFFADQIKAVKQLQEQNNKE